MTSSSSRSSSPTDSPQSIGVASPNARRMLRRHQKALAAMFSHERCHTRDDLVRMWAAERILETERGYIGDSFAPISPVLQAEDLEMRRKAALLFWGVGEPLELPSLSTPACAALTVANGQVKQWWRLKGSRSRAETSARAAALPDPVTPAARI